MSGNGGHRTPAPATPPKRVSPVRLLTTLGGAGFLAGALLVTVHQGTLPAITANRARALDRAITEVLRAPQRYDTLYVYQGALHRELPEGADPRGLERVFLGYDADNERVGYAVESGAPGFQDRIGLIFGYEPLTNRLLGMTVLQSNETPGLGDKIFKDTAFVRQFDGAAGPLSGIKPGTPREDRAQVHTITGATISSRAVIRAINDALARLGPLLEAHARGPAQ